MSRDKQFEEMENLNAEQIKYCLELILKSGIGMSRDDVDVTDIKRALALINSQEQRIKELAKEIFAELETSLMVSGCRDGSIFYEIRVEDYKHYKKKYTEEGE